MDGWMHGWMDDKRCHTKATIREKEGRNEKGRREVLGVLLLCSDWLEVA
jgi:hypothetical protein